MRGHKDLRLVVALAPLCAALALLVPVEGIALVFAVPPALVLPGYAIAAAAFAGRELGLPRMLLLSIGLSLAILALGALLLNYLGGIHPLSWALLLVLVVLAGSSAAAMRRGPAGSGRARPRLRLTGLELAMLLAALATATAAIAIANTARPAERAIGYTQLWILPKAGSGASEAQVGVRSQQQTPVSYDLRVRVGPSGVVRRSFRLQPGETRLVAVGPPPGGTGRIPVVATLLRHNQPFRVYRRVKGSLVASTEPR